VVEGISLDDLSSTNTIAFVLIAFLSLLMSTIVAGTIISNTKLKNTHPSILFGIIAVCLFILGYSLLINFIGTIKYICYWGMPQLFRHSVNLPR
jgi:hypothetical protein